MIQHQPLEKLDRVIEEIREMMVKSKLEAISKGKLNRGEFVIKEGQHKKKQQQRRGA
jgi:hypothetical protein